MYLVKRGHRILERTTGLEMAEAVAEVKSQGAETVTITSYWEETGETVIADYFDGHKV